MRLLSELALVAVLVLAISVSACGEGTTMTAKDVQATIASELLQGSSSEHIERFFKRHGLQYTYDRFSKRYQSIIRDVSSRSGTDHAIVIYLYVDDDKKFTRAEVRDSFTAP